MRQARRASHQLEARPVVVGEYEWSCDRRHTATLEALRLFQRRTTRYSAKPSGASPPRPPRGTDGPAGPEPSRPRGWPRPPGTRNRAARVASEAAISGLSATILGPS